MLRILTGLGLLLFVVGCHSVDTVKDEEAWIDLFNGVNLDGWDIKICGYLVNENYKNTFVVEDSMIRVNYTEYDSFRNEFGHLYYHQPYSYYKLRWEYRFTGDQLPGGATWNVRNSGVMLHSQSAQSNELTQTFPVSIEWQMLGGLSDGKSRPTGNVCTPGTAVEMHGEVTYDHCINSNSETYDGDQWVQAEAIVHGDEFMTFIVDGDTVLQFEKPQVGGGFTNVNAAGEDWKTVGGMDHPDDWIKNNGLLLKEGYIALQAESHPVDFRNIQLLDLCGCGDPKAKNYKAYVVQSKPESCIY